ncbi:MAG: site-specific DNA-methyltransferase [Alcaligenaceae bacterium]|nr:site-specific DNA-methyltransferase [Alcaligenaceae bacterium]
MEKLKMHSPNLTQENIARIRDLFPGCVTEAKGEDGNVKLAVDFDQLRQELSASIVEGPQERYHLNWPGKREALLTANAPIAKTLRPCRDESVDFDNTKNLFIEGDNLDALKLLQETYLGKVKMIYIDPPYNTGKDFIYKDYFAEDVESYRRRTNQRDSDNNRLVQNTPANGRFHSDWLSMIYSRLRLARNLLTTDGVIFISIDDSEVNNLIAACNEVFGESNHVATFIWKSKSGGANDSGDVAVDHEYIVCFSRQQVDSALGLDPDAVATTSYSNQDEHGRYSLERLDKQNLQYSSSMDYDLVGPDGVIYKLQHRDPSRPNAIWRWSKDRVANNMNLLVFKDGHVYTKNYERAGGKPRSLFVDERFGRTRTGSTEARDILGGDFFDNPKPTKLLKTVAAVGSTHDAIVLDFFAGSGSTADAVLRLNAEDGGNRRFIMVQLPEPCPEDSEAFKAGHRTIADISRERIRRVGKRALDGQCHENWSKDIGFRVLKIDTSNMADVYYAPDALDKANLDLFVDNIKPDRTPEDLLFQVMLDWGVDLALPISKETIQGRDVFFVDDNALAACFDAHSGIDEAFVNELAKRQPLRVVFRDAGFKDSSVKINVEQIFKLLSPATEVKCI